MWRAVLLAAVWVAAVLWFGSGVWFAGRYIIANLDLFQYGNLLVLVLIMLATAAGPLTAFAITELA